MRRCVWLLASALPLGYALNPVALAQESLWNHMRGTLRIHKTSWPDSPGGGRTSALFHAKLANRKDAIGTCGVEVLELNADGLQDGDDMAPRAVLSGTLFVNPAFRRQGIAQRLLMEAECQARWWAIGEMLLLVQKGNHAALKLYEKQGYVRMERTKNHASQICLRKNLFAPQNLHTVLPKLTVVDVEGR